MSKIIAIADDLTGAAEIAGLAYNFGLSVSVRMMHGIPDDFDEDVLVVNTDTRNLPQEKVSSRIDNALRCMNPKKGIKIFKKTDSLLRGWIETEISALLSASGYTSAILVPANPSRNRLIRNGRYYVNGEPIDQTEFLLDPEYPRTHSGVLELIRDRTEKTISGAPDRINVNGKIVIPDITSEDDIRGVIKSRIKNKALFCGGADLFQVLLSDWYKRKKEIIQPLTGNLHGKIFILGSCSNENMHAKRILKERGFALHTLTSEALENENDYEAWKAEITLLEGSNRGLILACPEARIKVKSSKEAITEKLVDIGAELASAEESATHFYITGGKTASLFCTRLDWNSFSVLPGTVNGTVTLAVENSKHLLTLKPGSYAWPEDILIRDR